MRRALQDFLEVMYQRLGPGNFTSPTIAGDGRIRFVDDFSDDYIFTRADILREFNAKSLTTLLSLRGRERKASPEARTFKY